MKKCAFLLPVVVLAVLAAGCGDNKTKEKIVNGGVISAGSSAAASATPASYSGAVAVNTAGMISKVGSGMGKMGLFAPSRAGRASSTLIPAGNGFYQYADLGSDFQIKFLAASDAVLDPSSIVSMMALAKIQVKIQSQYQYGTFNGDFVVDAALSSSTETVRSGTITSNDPVGGTFTATITPGMILEKTQTAAGTDIFVPKDGVMTITSTTGYTGTNTFSKSGSVYTCTGPINYGGTKVADVVLNWSNTFGNYTGHYVDTSTGETHAIQAQ